MKHLLKSWLPVVSGTKKFLAAELAHQLSRVINRRKFEVVYEGFIDLHNIDSEQPDVVVYDKEGYHTSVLLIEICEKNNLEPVLRTIEILSEIYHIKESFVYDLDNKIWYLLKDGSKNIEINSNSDFFQVDLNSLLNPQGLKSIPDFSKSNQYLTAPPLL